MIFTVALSLAACHKGEDNSILDFLPEKLTYTDGSGIWSTVLTIEGDGSFKGYFQEIADTETDTQYPGGTVYYCNFSGQFTDIKKVDANTYTMHLGEIVTEQEKGTTETDGGIRYIAYAPLGMTKNADYVLHCPNTPVDGLPENFLLWWPGRDAEPETLSCYGLRNTASNDGFFS